MSDARPLYAVLGVPAHASTDIIKRAYRKLALKHHPDKQKNPQSASEEDNTTFARIAFAYEILGDAQRRKRYDLTGELPKTDSATGRKAAETFFMEYVKSAPKTARSVGDADMSLHSLDNYEVLDVDGRDVPEYMRGIVMQGLGYLVAVVQDMEEKEVVLLRHYVMDQMYALLAYTPPLDAGAFEERGYVITYYDNPLQSGISAFWSDQNEGAPRQDAKASLKTIDAVIVEQRKLAALEWHAPSTNGAAPATKDVEVEVVPGEGQGRERLRSAMEALVKKEPDIGSFGIQRLRRELEKLLGLEQHSLDTTSGLLELFLEILEEMEDDEEDEKPAVTFAPGCGPSSNEARNPLVASRTPGCLSCLPCFR